jgi:hypothetical protein
MQPTRRRHLRKNRPLKDLKPTHQTRDVRGGRLPTKHPAKVTVPDIKL